MALTAKGGSAHGSAQAEKKDLSFSRPPSLSRLAELVSEHGAELRRLRAEHNALRLESQVLRRCLNSSGVLPAQTFEDEVRKDELRSPSRSAAAGGGTGGTPAAFPPSDVLEASRAAPVDVPRTAPRPTPAPSHGGGNGGSAPSAAPKRPAASASARAITPQKRPASTGSSTPVPRGRPERSANAAVSAAPVCRTPARAGGRPGSVEARRPSAGPASQRRGSPSSREVTPPRGRNGPAPGGARSRSVSGSPQRRALAREAAAQDLHELAQPLLLADSTPEQREQALGLVAQALRSGVGPHRWQGPGTPLRGAIQARQPELVQLLLQARADPNESDAKGVSVLHTASFDGQTALCKLLLQAKGDANVADRHGQTPLFFAPLRHVCEVLCQHRADVNVMNQKAQSALHLAGRAGLGEVLAWLGGHVSRALLEARDMHGATAAYYARHAGIQTSFLVKHRLMNFEPPPPAVGRSALSDAPGHGSPQRYKGTMGGRDGGGPHGATARHASDDLPDWCRSISNSERLPPLLEVPQLSDEEAEAATVTPSGNHRVEGERELLREECEQAIRTEADRQSIAAARIQASFRGLVARRSHSSQASPGGVQRWVEEPQCGSAAGVSSIAEEARPRTGEKKWRSLRSRSEEELSDADPATAAVRPGVRTGSAGRACSVAEEEPESRATGGPQPHPSGGREERETAAATRIQAALRGSFARREQALLPVAESAQLRAQVSSEEPPAREAKWRSFRPREAMPDIGQPDAPQLVAAPQQSEAPEEDLVTWEEDTGLRNDGARPEELDEESSAFGDYASTVGESSALEDVGEEGSAPGSARDRRRRQRRSRASLSQGYVYHIGSTGESEAASAGPGPAEVPTEKRRSVFDGFFAN